MTTPSQLNISYITDNEAITAEVTNRPITQLASYVANNANLINTLSNKNATSITSVTIAPDVECGNIVCFNETTQRFEKATNQLTSMQSYYTSSSTSNVVGIVSEVVVNQNTSNNNVGTIIISGEYNGPVKTIDNDHSYGTYYLSGQEAGKVTKVIPPIPVPVLVIIGTNSENNYRTIIQPTNSDLLMGHKHYKFDIATTPCGTVTEEHPETITNINYNIEGWLPVDDINSFSGMSIPEGAVYGYNISKSSFKNHWPPAPLSTIVLGWKPWDQKTIGIVDNTLVTFNNYGIWWMSDSTLPWNTENQNGYNTMSIWWTNPLFSINNSYIKKIQSGGGGITVEQDPGDSETWLIGHNVTDSVAKTQDVATYAITNITNGTFIQNPVISGIRSDSENIKISSIDENGETSLISYNGKDYNFGLINLEDTSGLNGRVVDIETVHQQSTRELFTNNLVGISFPASINSRLLAKAYIPRFKNIYTQNESLYIALRCTLYLTTTGTVSSDSLSINYVTLPYIENEETGTITATAINTTDAAFDNNSLLINNNITVPASNSNGYICTIETERSLITDGLGNIILMYLSRNANDIYKGDITLISKQLILYKNKTN